VELKVELRGKKMKKKANFEVRVDSYRVHLNWSQRFGWPISANIIYLDHALHSFNAGLSGERDAAVVGQVGESVSDQDVVEETI